MILRKNIGGAFGARLHPVPGKEEREEIRAVKAYVKAHCREKLSAERIAKDVGVSESYLVKIFGRETGFTLTQYLRKCRMEESAALLRGTDLRVKDIARAIGIDSPSWYSKCFRECYGMSPSEYRGVRGG